MEPVEERSCIERDRVDGAGIEGLLERVHVDRESVPPYTDLLVPARHENVVT